MSAAVAKSVEPTMEEILASIRKIIADDQDAPKAKAAKPAETPPAASRGAEAKAPALNGEESVPSKAVPPPRPRLVEPPPTSAAPPLPEPIPAALPDEPAPVIEALEEPEPEIVAPAPARGAVAALPDISQAFASPPAHQHKPEPDAPLISPEAGAAVSSAFGALVQTHLAQQMPPLEDVVREMLRPMLRTWLDDNLPTIVEKLVRAEIERVARGGRG
jgi:hypothetical protein